jgi:hypothetical protein
MQKAIAGITRGRWAALLGLVALAATGLGCGQLTIRTWVNVIGDESGGEILLNNTPQTLSRVQGGFLAVVHLDTRDLPGPLEGTIELADVRVAAQASGNVGKVCTWNDPSGASTGSVSLDLLGGGPSGAQVFLDGKATTTLSQFFGIPPVDFEQNVDLSLGSGLTLDAFTGALNSGSSDGLFASQTSITGNSSIGPIPVTFTLDLSVTNGATPPGFDADMLEFCGPYFAQQGTSPFYGLNSKSSYLRRQPQDDPKAPLVIALADLGAQPGDTLHISAVGTYARKTLAKDGDDTRLGAVFSASDVLRGPDERYRVQDAIDAGPDVQTFAFWDCFLFFCLPQPTDVPQDFRVDPQVDVVVPSGAAYLFVAPLDPEQLWKDNSGFGFGVEIAVNP